MRKTLLFITALILLLSVVVCLPSEAKAASDSDLTFAINSDGRSYSVVDCNTNATGVLIIPSAYGGYPVTAISDWAFEYCENLSSITIPDSVTAINTGAFANCYALTSIEIPDSVTVIKDYVFLSCKSLNTVTIPTGVKAIGNSVFNGCDSLVTVYYKGSKPQKSSISIGSNNDQLFTARWHYSAHVCSPGEVLIENVVAASCTVNGSFDQVAYCTSCGNQVYRKTVTVTAPGHTEETIPAVPATCTETGLTAGQKCSVCGETLVAQQIAPAAGHDFISGNTCANCGEVKTTTAPSLFVSNGEIIITNPDSAEITKILVFYTGEKVGSNLWADRVAAGKLYPEINGSKGYKTYTDISSLPTLTIEGEYIVYLYYLDENDLQKNISIEASVIDNTPRIGIDEDGNITLDNIAAENFTKVIVSYAGSDDPGKSWNSMVAAGKNHTDINGSKGYKIYINSASLPTLTEPGKYVLMLYYTQDGATKNIRQVVDVVEKKTVVTIGLPTNLMIEDYDTNALTLWIEEQTGYDIQFFKYASSPADYKTQLAVQILDPNATLPHMMIHMADLGEANWKTYGDEGYFLDLTDYLMDKEGKSKIWWEMAEYFDTTAVQAAIERCSSEDRTKIYALPSMEKSLVDPLPFIAHINTEWLEQVGMDAPTNPDELYNVLKAFKAQCCKGQGYYPMLSGGSSVLGSDGIWWIMSFFCPQYSYDNYFGLSADGKTLTTPFTTEGYREGLKFIRKLMSEGLLPDNTATMPLKDAKAILNSGDSAKCGVIVFHTTPAFNNANNHNLYTYVPLDMYPSNQQPNYPSSYAGAFVTQQAEEDGVVDACWDILMLLSSKEGAIRLRYGEEGVNWTWAEEDSDAKSYLGFDCWINLLDDPFSRPNNEMWGTPSPTLNPQAEGEYVNAGTMSEWLQYRYWLNAEGYRNFYKAQENNGYLIPDIVMTQTENDATKYERQNTQNAIKTWMIKFMNDSAVDPNNDATWQQYLNELDAKGLQTWLNQYQGIYEARYMETVLANN